METAQAASRDELRRALDDRQFSLAFQPEYDLSTSTIVAAEALARWTHPDRGEVLPEGFIDATVRYGLIDELTSWVIDAALAQLGAWAAAVDSLRVTMRINLTLAHLARPRFVTEFADALSTHGVAPAQVCLEITETAPLLDPSGTAAVVRQLQSLGVSVAIDDLASGYSTLGSLRWLPVDVVKVDRTLIAGIDADIRAAIILSAIVTVARELDIALVAEGVENDREAAVLLSLGCNHAQGNYLGRPMPGPELLDLLLVQCGASSPPAPAPRPAPTVAPAPAVRRRPLPRPR